jgi:nicotinamidase-related amidase
MAGLIFWDVDTQNDFMHADGKLYVPKAEEIILMSWSTKRSQMTQTSTAPILHTVCAERQVNERSPRPRCSMHW